MPTPNNQILQFGKGSGANVLTPGAYAALTTLLNNGFQAGLAESVKFNTVLRQSSFIATMIAQFICDQALVDVIDDGDLSTLKTNFIAALNALVGPEISALATALDTALANEATLRANADTAEANTRWTADNALQVLITALQGKVGAVGATDLQTQINNINTTVNYPKILAAGTSIAIFNGSFNWNATVYAPSGVDFTNRSKYWFSWSAMGLGNSAAEVPTLTTNITSSSATLTTRVGNGGTASTGTGIFPWILLQLSA